MEIGRILTNVAFLMNIPSPSLLPPRLELSQIWTRCPQSEQDFSGALPAL